MVVTYVASVTIFVDGVFHGELSGMKLSVKHCVAIDNVSHDHEGHTNFIYIYTCLSTYSQI